MTSCVLSQVRFIPQRVHRQLYLCWSNALAFKILPCLYSTMKSEQDPRTYDITKVRKLLTEMVGTRKEWGSKQITAGTSYVMQAIPNSQDELSKKVPSDSYSRTIIPLSTNEDLRDLYVNHQRGIRFGRLLEDFDSFSGLMCYKHNKSPELGDNQKSPLAFVTALVDRIEIADPPLDPFQDIVIDGNITWTGRSSMECTMHMAQELDGQMKRRVTAKYLFVARNPLTDKAVCICPLHPETPEEKKLFQLGEDTKQLRMLEGQKSLLKLPPSEEERLIIHDLFLATVDQKAGTLKPMVKPKNAIYMDQTVLKNLHVCHPEVRNLYNKIFGGYLMRMAFELAWTDACLYSKTKFVKCKVVDDIVFQNPVEIGSLLFMSAQVVYTNGPDVEVKVHAEVVNPTDGSRLTTNYFYFIFDTGNPSLPRVIPKTYAEAMVYLDGKRHYES